MAGSSRYQKVGVIASGGMATVYFGRVHGAGGFKRPVAIKVMHPHIAQNPEFVSMFLDEGRLAARIQHVNVVATVDVEADEGGVFLVMEYVDGLSLHRLAKNFRSASVPIPPSVVLRVMVDTLAGLHAAHELRADDGAPLLLVHRDVSPQNILVGTDGVTRLTDFGVARAESRLSAATRTGQVKGKVAYMSTEQLRSRPLDRRSDVYSAAIVLWELLAGERLFRGDSEGAVALAAAEGATKAPSEVNPRSPKVFDALVMKALSKDPVDRFPTAAVFGEALENAGLCVGIHPAKPRFVGQLLKADPDASDDQLPEECRPVARLLRAEVIAAHAKASTPIGDSAVRDSSGVSHPTDKLAPFSSEPPSSNSERAASDQQTSSPKTNVPTVITDPVGSRAPGRRMGWLGVGAVLLVLAVGSVWYLRARSGATASTASDAMAGSGPSSTAAAVTVEPLAPLSTPSQAPAAASDVASSVVASASEVASAERPTRRGPLGPQRPGPPKGTDKPDAPTAAPPAAKPSATFRPTIL